MPFQSVHAMSLEPFPSDPTQDPPPGPPEAPPGLPPLQFSLAALLATVAGICVLLAAMTYVGPLGAFALLMLALSIVAHIAGNSIGTFLRDTGGRSQPNDLPPVRDMQARATERDFAEATELRQTTDISETLIVSASVGAGVGALCGGGLLVWVNWERLTLFNVTVGAIAFAIIGALFGAAIGSFVRIGLSAYRQSAATAYREVGTRNSEAGTERVQEGRVQGSDTEHAHSPEP